MLIPVILSGGAGVRLWPESRADRPKPFLKLTAEGGSLLAQAVDRALAVSDVGQAVVVTNQDYLFPSLDDLGERAGKLSFLLEGCARNTGAAVLLAAHFLRENYGEQAVMLVLAADHVIQDQAAFAQAVRSAQAQAELGKAVTFGIRPTRPETGYGYLATGEPVAEQVFAVERFVEKPDAPTAQEYVASGRYLWNSGMFCFQVGALLALAEKVAPELARASAVCYAAGLAGREGHSAVKRFPREAMAAVPSISIDYAVMEKASDIVTVACAIGWSDVGAWDAVRDMAAAKDAEGNVTSGDATLLRSANCLVRAHGGKKVAVLGGKNLVIVDTPEALLVLDAAEAQGVKELVGKVAEG